MISRKKLPLILIVLLAASAFVFSAVFFLTGENSAEAASNGECSDLYCLDDMLGEPTVIETDGPIIIVRDAEAPRNDLRLKPDDTNIMIEFLPHVIRPVPPIGVLTPSELIAAEFEEGNSPITEMIMKPIIDRPVAAFPHVTPSLLDNHPPFSCLVYNCPWCLPFFPVF